MYHVLWKEGGLSFHGLEILLRSVLRQQRPARRYTYKSFFLAMHAACLVNSDAQNLSCGSLVAERWCLVAVEGVSEGSISALELRLIQLMIQKSAREATNYQRDNETDGARFPYAHFLYCYSCYHPRDGLDGCTICLDGIVDSIVYVNPHTEDPDVILFWDPVAIDVEYHL